MKVEQNLIKKVGIYKIVNTINNKCYIGSSKNIYYRGGKHKSLLKHNKHENAYLQNAINKYKLENFTFSLIEECLFQDLLLREQHYIDLLKPDYNITKSVTRNTLSKESRIKISNTLKARYANEEIKVKCNKKIDRYSLKGIYIDSFNSLAEAERKLNIKSKNIRRVLNGTYIKAGGFQWKESKSNLEIKDISNINKKTISIKVIDTFDNSELLFNSISKTEKHFKVCRGTFYNAILKKTLYKKRYRILPL